MNNANKTNGKTPIRFGIIVQGATLLGWQVACIGKMTALPDVEMVLTLVRVPDSNTSNPGRSRKTGSLNRLLWDRYNKSFVLSRVTGLRVVEIASAFPDLPRIAAEPDSDRRLFDGTSKDDIAKVRSQKLDFLLSFGDEPVLGVDESIARHGVWRFRFGDGMGLREGPPCFWEVYSGIPLIETALVRISDDSVRKSRVLRRARLKTTRSYTRSLNLILAAAQEFPADVCRGLREGDPEVAQGLEDGSADGFIASSPSNAQMVAFTWGSLRRSFASAISISRSLLFDLEQQWNVGVSEAPIAAYLKDGARPRIRWMPSPEKGWFAADPFGSEKDSNVVILFEEFDPRSQKGQISTVVQTPGGAFSKPEKAIDLKHHASYPFLLKSGDEIYCVPETFHADETNLFRATEFPGRWEKVCTLLEGVRAVDPTIIQHDGRWWLFYSLAGRVVSDNSRLYLMHAADLKGPWIPHPMNPVKIDISSSRPGGTPFVHEGQLYRPAQDCTVRYGQRIAINLVTRLTPTAFDEERVATVEPYADSEYRDGLHTLSAVGEVTLIDGLKLTRTRKNLRTAFRGAISRVRR